MAQLVHPPVEVVPVVVEQRVHAAARAAGHVDDLGVRRAGAGGERIPQGLLRRRGEPGVLPVVLLEVHPAASGHVLAQVPGRRLRQLRGEVVHPVEDGHGPVVLVDGIRAAVLLGHLVRGELVDVRVLPDVHEPVLIHVRQVRRQPRVLPVHGVEGIEVQPVAPEVREHVVLVVALDPVARHFVHVRAGVPHVAGHVGHALPVRAVHVRDLHRHPLHGVLHHRGRAQVVRGALLVVAEDEVAVALEVALEQRELDLAVHVPQVRVLPVAAAVHPLDALVQRRLEGALHRRGVREEERQRGVVEPVRDHGVDGRAVLHVGQRDLRVRPADHQRLHGVGGGHLHVRIRPGRRPFGVRAGLVEDLHPAHVRAPGVREEDGRLVVLADAVVVDGEARHVVHHRGVLVGLHAGRELQLGAAGGVLQILRIQRQHALATGHHADGVLAQVPVAVLEVHRVERADEVVGQAERVAHLVRPDEDVHRVAHLVPGVGLGLGLRRLLAQPLRLVFSQLLVVERLHLLRELEVGPVAELGQPDGLHARAQLPLLFELHQVGVADHGVPRHLPVEGRVRHQLLPPGLTRRGRQHRRPDLGGVDHRVLEERVLGDLVRHHRPPVLLHLRQRALELGGLEPVLEHPVRPREGGHLLRPVRGQPALRLRRAVVPPRVGGLAVLGEEVPDVLAAHDGVQGGLAGEHLEVLQGVPGHPVHAGAVHVGHALDDLPGLRVGAGGAIAQRTGHLRVVHPVEHVVADVSGADEPALRAARRGRTGRHRVLAEVEHLRDVSHLEAAGHRHRLAVGAVPLLLDDLRGLHQRLRVVLREVVDDGLRVTRLDGQGVAVRVAGLAPDVVPLGVEQAPRQRDAVVPVVGGAFAVVAPAVPEEAELLHHLVAVDQRLVVLDVGLVHAADGGAHLDDRAAAVHAGLQEAVRDLPVARVEGGGRVPELADGEVEVLQPLLAIHLGVIHHQSVVARLLVNGLHPGVELTGAPALPPRQRHGADALVVRRRVAAPVHAHEVALVPGAVAHVLDQHVGLLTGGGVVLADPVEVAGDAPRGHRRALVGLAVHGHHVADARVLRVHARVGAGQPLVGAVRHEVVLLHLEADLLHVTLVTLEGDGGGGRHADDGVPEVPGAFEQVGLLHVVGLGAVHHLRPAAAARGDEDGEDGGGPRQGAHHLGSSHVAGVRSGGGHG